jgi:hypothetical protein
MAVIKIENEDATMTEITNNADMALRPCTPYPFLSTSAMSCSPPYSEYRPVTVETDIHYIRFGLDQDGVWCNLRTVR